MLADCVIRKPESALRESGVQAGDASTLRLQMEKRADHHNDVRTDCPHKVTESTDIWTSYLFG